MKKIEYIERKTGEIKIENPPGEAFLKFLYFNPFGKLALNGIVKRKFLSEFYGRKMRASSSKAKILPFIEANGINIDESIKKIEEFQSFNDFFIREIKKEARPIEKDENIFVSPADGKVLVFENIDEVSKFFVKGEEFNLDSFFKDSRLSKKYRGGALAIVRLAPVDYHRFHFPADGKILKNKAINGYYYSVSPYAIKNNLSIFWENKREYAELQTKKFGDVILSEIGATMVGGIVQTFKENSEVKKGEEKGYFFFGGSTCILLFEKNKIKFDNDLVENTKKGIETKIYMGERIGVSFEKE